MRILVEPGERRSGGTVPVDGITMWMAALVAGTGPQQPGAADRVVGLAPRSR